MAQHIWLTGRKLIIGTGDLELSGRGSGDSEPDLLVYRLPLILYLYSVLDYDI